MNKKRNIRLPDYIQPITYDIHLTPDLDAFVFSGEEIITLDIKKEVTKITLHSTELDIESASVIQGKSALFAKKISYDVKKETVTFDFKSKIKIGKQKIKILFRGILNDKMHGFYRSTYVVDGKTHHLATTQFESTDARRAFPCIDEPAAKATFCIKLTIPSALTAISNTMPVDIKEHEGGFKTVTFSPSPKMSTYLAAFIAGDLECIQGKTKEGVLVRVFTTPGKKHQAQFALTCAIKTLSYFTEYFNIAYPLPVLDLIAIPDFASGAMENWGAVTYRESALLIDEENSSAASRQWVALVVAHELSHQWFGNLVTMEWWTHLWLNEGFASYIEYLAVDHIFPEWDIWTQFAFSDLGVALRLDALKTTHPIEVEVHHPDEISEIFDGVSYSKGASIIRMLASYLGEEDFRDGLRYYLKNYSYKNTSTEHLWESLERISRKPVERIMKNWTSKPGYPVLHVEDIGNEKMRISQSRFFSSKLSKKRNKENVVWSVPLHIKTIDNKIESEYLLTKKSQVLPMSPSIFKLNSGETGVFRTTYQNSNWKNFKEGIISQKISPIDRLGLIRDVLALAEAGEVSTDMALEFLTYYKNEIDYTVWREISSGLSRIYNLLSQENFRSEYKKYASSIFSEIYKKVGWKPKPNERHTDKMLRSLVLVNLAIYGTPEVLLGAKKLFSKVSASKNPLDPNIRSAAYIAISEIGGNTEYKKLVDLYKMSGLSEEKSRIGNALGNFSDKKLLAETLKFAISKDVRYQDAVSIINSVTINPNGFGLTWKFLKQQWSLLLSRYEGRNISNLIWSLGVAKEMKILNDIKKFYSKNSIPGAERTLEQVIEKIESNNDWFRRDKLAIKNYLKKFNP